MTISAPTQTSPYDGLVSRYLNRHVSRPVARLLARTPVTPNQVTVFSLGIATGALAGFGAETLLTLAVLTNVVALLRVVSARRALE